MVELFERMTLVYVVTMKADRSCSVIVHPANTEAPMLVFAAAIVGWSVVSWIAHNKNPGLDRVDWYVKKKGQHTAVARVL